MQRVTEKHLDAVVERINILTGSPLAPYTKTAVVPRANVGNYHLDWAYGKVRLVRMGNAGGGIETITQYGTKRECLAEMHAFIRGYSASQTKE